MRMGISGVSIGSLIQGDAVYPHDSVRLEKQRRCFFPALLTSME
jgi:hypothetical protein